MVVRGMNSDGWQKGLHYRFALCSAPESRQAIGLVTFAGMLVATVVGIAFPPAYFALFSRLRARGVRG